MIRKGFFFAFLLCLASEAEAQPYSADKFFAHRGLSRFAPENTVLSFLTAEERGFIKLELDVSAISGNDLLVFHDTSLERVFGDKTDLCRISPAQTESLVPAEFFFRENFNLGPKEVASLKEIADPWLEKLFSAKVPRLEEVFSRFGKKFTYHLDIKRINCEGKRLQMVAKMVELIKANDLTEHVYVESRDLSLLLEFRALAPEIKLIYWNDAVFSEENEFIAAIKNTGIVSLDFYYGHYNEEKKEKLEGLKLHSYTLNGKDTIAAFYHKIDYLITDDDVICSPSLDAVEFFNSRSSFVRIERKDRGKEKPKSASSVLFETERYYFTVLPEAVKDEHNSSNEKDT